MQVKISHNGTRDVAIARIKEVIEQSRDKISKNATELKESWSDNVLSFAFTAQGQHIEGTLTVLDGEYELYAKLPLALRLFEGTLERMIEAEAKKMSI